MTKLQLAAVLYANARSMLTAMDAKELALGNCIHGFLQATESAQELWLKRAEGYLKEASDDNFFWRG